MIIHIASYYSYCFSDLQTQEIGPVRAIIRPTLGLKA